MMTRLRAIDTRKCAVLGTDTSTRCAITDSIKSPPEIVFLRVKSSDVQPVYTRGELDLRLDESHNDHTDSAPQNTSD